MSSRFREMILISVVLVVCAGMDAECSVLKSAYLKAAGTGVKLILELDSMPVYKVTKGNSYTVITLNNSTAGFTLPRTLQSKALDGLKIESRDGNCIVSADYRYITSCKITVLKKPYRIIADFRKLSNMRVPKISIPEIAGVTTRSLEDKFRIVVDLTSFVPYKIITAEGGLIIELPDTNSIIKSRKIITKDKLIPKVGIDQVGKSTLIGIVQNYPSFYQIYKLDNPARLVIEFDKTSKTTIAANSITTGLQYVKLVKGTEEGPVTVNCLLVDQNLLSVAPYLGKQKEESPTFFGTIGSLFTFWVPKEEVKFRREKVSDMIKETGAIAGVNGMFFGSAGEPLGVLMINGELLSYSINDRTALIIDKNNRCYIDNVSLSGEASIEGTIVQISGINSKRRLGEAIVYTPRYGNQTNEETPGIVLSVVGNKVKDVNRVRGWIPKDGYVLSMDPTYYETLGSKVGIGSEVGLTLKLIPLSAIQDLEIKHVIGGGPRLLKAGNIYISKNSEKFKSDIAKSRAARTCVGISKEGTLIFATVDKCKQSTTSNKSVGVTLEELAQIMKDLNCVDAMNLDGGSSSTMVLSSEVLNIPSSGSEIAVSNGILITK